MVRWQSNLRFAIFAQLSAEVDSIDEGRRLKHLLPFLQGALIRYKVVGIHVGDSDGCGGFSRFQFETYLSLMSVH